MTILQCPARRTVRHGEAEGTYRCEEIAGHPGQHRNEDAEMFWDDSMADAPNTMTPGTAQTPERCGHSNAPSVALTCTLAAGHRGAFHRADDGSTWSSADDPQGPPSLQHDACGARLTVSRPGEKGRLAWEASWVCALGPHDVDDQHRAADGTQWRASDFPPADAMGRILSGTSPHVLAAQVRQQAQTIAKFQAALSRKGECICPTVAVHSADDAPSGEREDDELCPKHGAVATMVTQLTWAASFTDRIIAALGEPWSGAKYVSSADAAEEVARRIDHGDQLDAVQAELRAAGIFANTTNGVRDLAMQRDGNAEHAENAEAALARIAEVCRTRGGDDAMREILEITQEKNR